MWLRMVIVSANLSVAALPALAGQEEDLPPFQLTQSASDAGSYAVAQANRVSRDDVITLQTVLDVLGYDVGAVDGQFGPATRRALLDFQRTYGLPVSGEFDEETKQAVYRQVSRGVAPKNSGTPAGREVMANDDFLDVPIMVEGGDGQSATCWSATVARLNPRGDGFLAIRSGPGSRYRKIGELYNGDVVNVVEMRGKWAGVIYGKNTGEACAARRSYELKNPERGWIHSNWLESLAG